MGNKGSHTHWERSETMFNRLQALCRYLLTEICCRFLRGSYSAEVKFPAYLAILSLYRQKAPSR